MLKYLTISTTLSDELSFAEERDPSSIGAYTRLVMQCFKHESGCVLVEKAKKILRHYNYDIVIKILEEEDIISLSDTEIKVIGIEEKIENAVNKNLYNSEKQKKYRERKKEYDSNNQLKPDDANNVDLGSVVTDSTEHMDYKKLVQLWEKSFPMSDVQLRTSYNRLKSGNWNQTSVLSAISFLKSNPEIKNKIMCDWYERGCFATDFDLNKDKIKDLFCKKRNGKTQDMIDNPGDYCSDGSLVAGSKIGKFDDDKRNQEFIKKYYNKEV